MAALSPRPGSSADDATPGVRARILCVDDSAVALKMCERWLGRDGHAVACVPSAEAALEILESEHFDLVLLDVNLPGLDGNNALAALRERHHLRHVPVIMMSNDSMEARIVRWARGSACWTLRARARHPGPAALAGRWSSAPSTT